MSPKQVALIALTITKKLLLENQKQLKIKYSIVKMGRVTRIELANTGTTNRGLNHLAIPAIAIFHN
jgi:hypothetical protein